METNMYTQVLPILSMIFTIILIKKSVSLDAVPGFGKLSGLILVIGVLMVIMWIIDKTHIYAVTFMPFWVVVLILVAGFLLIRSGYRRITG